MLFYRIRIQIILMISPTYCAQSKQARKGILDGVTEKVTLAQERMQRNYNRGTKETEVHPGDWVWLRHEARSHTLSPMFGEPWLVVEKQGVNVHLSNPDGARREVVHLNRCKKAAKHLSLEDESSSQRFVYLGEKPSTEQTIICEYRGDSTDGAIPGEHGDNMNSQTLSEHRTLENNQHNQDYSNVLRRSVRSRKEPKWYGERVVWSSKGISKFGIIIL